MIAPDVEVIGLEPEGYAWLCDRVAGRHSLQGEWLWGRHDGSYLLASVPALTSGDPALTGIDLGDPAAAARRLREALGLERVVLVDQRHSAALARRLDDAATPSRTQWEFFRACQATFWSSPAIATSPDAPADRWDDVSRALQTAGDLDFVLLVMEANTLFLGLRATVRQGLMVRLTGALPDGEDAPRDLEGRIARVDASGTADVLVACSRAALEAAFDTVDVVAALVGVATSPDVLHTRGLERLGALFTVGVAP
jgi:hypothetical protein